MSKYLNIDPIFERTSIYKILDFLGFKKTEVNQAVTYAIYTNSIGERLIIFCKEETEELLAISNDGNTYDSIGLLINYSVKHNLHNSDALDLVQKITKLSSYSANDNPQLLPSNYNKVRTHWLNPIRIDEEIHKIPMVTSEMLFINLDNTIYQSINSKETKNLIYFKTSHWSKTIFFKPFTFKLNAASSKSLYILHSYNDCVYFNQNLKQRHEGYIVKGINPDTNQMFSAYDQYNFLLNSTFMEQDSLVKHYLDLLNSLSTIINLFIPNFITAFEISNRTLYLRIPLLEKQFMKNLFLSITKAKKENREKLYYEHTSTDKTNISLESYEDPNQIKYDTASKTLIVFLSFENVSLIMKSLVESMNLSMIKIHIYDLYDYKYLNSNN